MVDFADFFLFADHFGQPAQGKLLALAQELIGLPDEPLLLQNAPNPFNSQTVISYFLVAAGPARLELFALTGQRVAVLSKGTRRRAATAFTGTAATMNDESWPAASISTGWSPRRVF